MITIYTFVDENTQENKCIESNTTPDFRAIDKALKPKYNCFSTRYVAAYQDDIQDFIYTLDDLTEFGFTKEAIQKITQGINELQFKIQELTNYIEEQEREIDE